MPHTASPAPWQVRLRAHLRALRTWQCSSAPHDVQPPAQPAARPPAACRVCGVSIKSGRSYCASCGVTVSRENLVEVAKRGRVTAQSPEARARQAEEQRRHADEVKAWSPSDKPEWLTEEYYREKIQPLLSGITVPAISSGLGISVPYAAEIRAGRQSNPNQDCLNPPVPTTINKWTPASTHNLSIRQASDAPGQDYCDSGSQGYSIPARLLAGIQALVSSF